jgi:predicted phage baseplate assembly protein
MFTASYRLGNGRAGNIGADTLVHVVSGQDGIAGVSNPLPARGGVEMETIEEVRQVAPFAFRPQSLPGQPSRPDGRTLGRAVTPADYAALAETASVLETNDVQRAAATFRWTGSWRTMSIAVDRRAGGPVTQEFEDGLRAYMEPYRLAGHDLEVEPPQPVALEIAMTVRVRPGYFVSQVRRALLEVFSNRLLADGRRGVFHPDNLTFGQTIYLSPLYAAAQAVDGVESVDITTFQRRDRPGTEALDAGRLTLGRLEIARLDNDPNFRERGVFELTLEGGR